MNEEEMKEFWKKLDEENECECDKQEVERLRKIKDGLQVGYCMCGVE
tara:strand:+ start:2791 stop:2931 length:141 start_codon:yes stop_codon:yes gene_type:complete